MVTRNKKKSVKNCYRITKSNDNCRIDTYNQSGCEGSFAFQKHHGWWQQVLVFFDGLEEVLFGLFMLKKKRVEMSSDPYYRGTIISFDANCTGYYTTLTKIFKN